MTASSLVWVRSFWLIATVGWRMSYGIYGAAMGIGIIATLFAREPERADVVMDEKQRDAPLWTWRGFFDAVVGPFIAFFRAHGWLALVMLAAISLYRVPDSKASPINLEESLQIRKLLGFNSPPSLN